MYEELHDFLAEDELLILMTFEGLAYGESLTKREMMTRINLKERVWYTKIQKMRNLGIPVIAEKSYDSGALGYRLARTKAELDEFMRGWHKTIGTQYKTLKNMKKYRKHLQ